MGRRLVDVSQNKNGRIIDPAASNSNLFL